jgi:CRISPR-associated protein Cas1
MYSLPDFLNKQILFIQNELDHTYYLKLNNQNLVYAKDGQNENKISTHKLFAVFICGHTSFSTQLVKELIGRGVSIFFLKNNFETYAQIDAQAEGNYLLRHQQYHQSETDQLAVAKKIVKNKVQNQLRLIKKALADSDYLKMKKKLEQSLDQISNSQDLLALEANFSKMFFQEYFKPIGWVRRVPRAKPDIPNFLLDMGYTFLFNTVDALLRLHGFDTYKGVYHKLFFMRRSLACDLMEPFRCIIDKQLLKAYNLDQINPKDFKLDQINLTLDFQKRGKYAKIFSQTIMDHREDIFKYIRGYYLNLMRPEVYEFPTFKIQI